MLEAYKLNCLSAMRMTAACRPHLLAAENPSVTNSGSMVGVAPAFEFLAYSAAKAALNHLMLGLAHYFTRQIRVNSVVIGTVPTPGYADVGLNERIQHALARSQQPHRTGEHAAGRSQCFPVARVAGRQLGQRLSDAPRNAENLQRLPAWPAEAAAADDTWASLKPPGCSRARCNNRRSGRNVGGETRWRFLSRTG
jgi:NAD(P)-dependent dehydrogenase (short-subunit alcohol dehydrogenase family)